MAHTINNFLKNINVKKTDHENVVVMGNESCDLDSAVSSLIYAYFLYWIDLNDEFSKNSSDSKQIIPILNVNRIDLPIKTEVVYYLNQNGILLDNIICRDEVNIESLLSDEKSRLILVDHHILCEADEKLFSYVKNIFDHRPKDTISWRYNEDVVSKIVEVGSCSTIICSEINSINNYQFLEKNKDCSNLLYGTIILDTINLNPKADKARPLDFQMINILEKVLHISDSEHHRKQLFDDLIKARTDYSQLTVNHLLKRDLKIVKNVPIPGLPMLVKEYFNMQGSFDAVEAFYTENNCSTVLLMGLKVENDVVHRDLAVYDKNENKDKIIKSLLDSTTPDLGLIEKYCQHEYCKYFWQSNTKASRKQIIPILKTLNT